MSEKESDISKRIKSQYNILSNGLNLPLDSKVKRVLLPQSVLGMVHEGHSLFAGNPRPDISQQEIFENIGFDQEEARAYRENLILDFVQCIDDLFAGRKNKLTNRRREPIFGANFLEDVVLEVDKNFFKGGVLAGRMDSSYWRRETQENFQKTLEGRPLNIGYGEDFIIDLDVMKKEGISLRDLSHNEHNKKDVKNLISNGIISSNGSNESAYIRFREGLGCCDDASLIAIGKICGEDSMLLGWGVDGVDTYTKFVGHPKKGGFDKWIARHIERLWRNKYSEELVTPEEQMAVIYLGAKNNDPFIPFSSSHRRLCQKEKKQKHSTIINHYKFVKEGKVPPTHDLGFERISSDKFYSAMDKRIESFNEKYPDYFPSKL